MCTGNCNQGRNCDCKSMAEDRGELLRQLIEAHKTIDELIKSNTDLERTLKRKCEEVEYMMAKVADLQNRLDGRAPWQD